MKPPTPPPQQERTSSEHSPLVGSTTPAQQSLALTLDLDAYLGQLDDWDISEEKKTEFIVTLWNLLLSFAEMGFEIHPAQLAAEVGRKSTEKTSKAQEKPGLSTPDLLYSRPDNHTHIIRKPDALGAAGIEESSIEERSS